MKHIKTPSPELQEVNDKIYDLVRRCIKPDDYDRKLDKLLKRQNSLEIRRGQAMKETREIGRIEAISVKCKVCNKVFAMNRREIMWYSNMGYPLPKRCPECRKKRKEGKEHEKKANANAGQPERLYTALADGVRD